MNLDNLKESRNKAIRIIEEYRSTEILAASKIIATSIIYLADSIRQSNEYWQNKDSSK